MRATLAATAVAMPLLGAAGCSTSEQAADAVPDAATASEAAADVTVAKCEPGAYGTFNPQLTIINSIDKPATFTVTVCLNGPDGARLAEANAFANAIAAGQTATVEAAGQLENPPAGVTCAVASVIWFAP